jgi:Fe-S cluster assembly protein SufD
MTLPQGTATSHLATAPVPAWLAEIRRQAAQDLSRVGLPDRKEENWKYTAAKKALESNSQLDTQASESDEISLPDSLDMDDAWSLVLVDGQIDDDLTELENLPEGVELVSLEDALAEGGHDWLSEAWWQSPATRDQGFSLLNSVWAGQGLVVRVAAGVELERPIHLLTIDSGSHRGQLLSLRNIIQLGEGAKVDVVEEHRSSDEGCGFSNVLSQVALARGAQLSVTRVTRLADQAHQVNRLVATLASEASLTHRAIDLGGALVRNDLDIDLVDEQASLTMDGLYLVGGKQHVDNHTLVKHSVPNTSSEQIYRGILAGQGHGVFNGKAYVEKGADGTEAHQNNANLLLSKRAEIDTKPELEIYAEDVVASHGATVGQLDSTALFYLRSRGLSEAKARRLLMEAFAWELIDRMPEGSLREQLLDEVGRVLDGLTGE